MLALVVLAAGKGTRMRAELPKVLHPLLGVPLLEYAFEHGDGLGVERVVAVVGWGRDAIREAFARRTIGGRALDFAVQEEQLGTGHAAHVGVSALGDFQGDVLVLNGDLPLLRHATLEHLVARHRETAASVTVLTCEKSDPSGFGRIVRGAGGRLAAIVEEADCDGSTRAVRDVNVGTYLFRTEAFRRYYERVGRDNDQGELYLTDVVVEAARDGQRVETVAVLDDSETAQVNSQKELAFASSVLRGRIVDELLDRGVRIDDPASAYIERDVEIASGARIHPFCVIRRGVRIGPGCEVGPFAHLRAGSDLRSQAKVGNFCEVKNSVLGERSKTSHLSYVGDADVGDEVNIGAGTVFANYDGRQKHRTIVGARTFIGSGTVLVAPVTIGDDATTGAGSVVLRGRDVADGEVVAGVPARPLASSRKPAGSEGATKGSGGKVAG